MKKKDSSHDTSLIKVRGARENNLKDIDLDIPRDSLVVFTGISGSGKSSLAFGTLYAEAQRRYLESVSPYARRLFHQLKVPEVDEVTGLPPAVALQQQRGAPTSRSSVGSITTLSHLIRMLYSRAGKYPRGEDFIPAEGFSPNTPQGACPQCHGLGRNYDVTEKSLVPDDSLTIRERAIAAWPPAWHGQNLRDMLVTLGFNIDIPWKKLPKKDREWILFTEEQPSVPVYAGFESHEVKAALRSKMEPSYHGNFSSARRYVLETYAKTTSPLMKKRVSRYMVSTLCSECKGKRLKRESLRVKFANLDISQISALPLKELAEMFHSSKLLEEVSQPELKQVIQRISEDLTRRIEVLLDLGLGHLSLTRTTPTLSPGELQRLRLATQVHSQLFGVVYVLDEPSAGLHPADTQALLRTFDKLKAAGNSLFIVEHNVAIMNQADWLVDVGPGAGEGGGHILYSGPPSGLLEIKTSHTRRYILNQGSQITQKVRPPEAWLKLKNLKGNNLDNLDVNIPIGVMTTVTGVSGSGKSTLVSQIMVNLFTTYLGTKRASSPDLPELEHTELPKLSGKLAGGQEHILRLIQVDQKPIGRTPRSNLATYTGLFDHVRKVFASTKLARSRRYDAGRFSFNLPKGRCPNCEGEGFVMVELLFLPSVYGPCPVCHGDRFNAETLEVKYQGKNIAEVLRLSVDEAFPFFENQENIQQSLRTLQEVGLGYLRLGQPATELSGGEAQRIKLATELQRTSKGDTLFILDEPTTGLHPSDVERLLRQLSKLAELGNTVLVVEHDLQIIGQSDWIIDMGPGAGEEGGKIVAQGSPREIMNNHSSLTGRYLKEQSLLRFKH